MKDDGDVLSARWDRFPQKEPMSGSVIFAAVGDVHGRWSELARDLEIARSFLPPGRTLDAIIQVGDAEPTATLAELDEVHCKPERRRLSDFARVLNGELEFGAPFYFIGGNHEPWQTLDRHGGVSKGSSPLAADIQFLGRSGTACIEGMRVGFLSGIRRPGQMLVSASERDRRRSTWESSFYVAHELEQIRSAGGVDLLVTHEWPSGSPFVHKTSHVGDDNVRELLSALSPAASFHGHYHRADSYVIDGVPVFCRGRYGQGVPEWVSLYEFDHMARSVRQLNHVRRAGAAR